MIVFEFCYSSCIHEESPVTISIHKTKKGAIKAMKVHKAKEKRKWKEFMNLGGNIKYHSSFGKHESWGIKDTEVFE